MKILQVNFLKKQLAVSYEYHLFEDCRVLGVQPLGEGVAEDHRAEARDFLSDESEKTVRWTIFSDSFDSIISPPALKIIYISVKITY